MDQESADHVTDFAAVQRQLADALERTETLGQTIETLGQTIETCLDDAEKELAEIKRVGIPSRLPA